MFLFFFKNIPTSRNLQRTFTEKSLHLEEPSEAEIEEKEDVFVTVEKLEARDVFVSGIN